MEKTRSDDRSLLVTILSISIANMVLTLCIVGVFVLVIVMESSESGSSTVEQISLPTDLATKESRDDKLTEIQRAFNSKGYEQLLSLYGEAYQIHLRTSDFEKRFEVLHALAPRINDGAYVFYEFESLGSGYTKFHLYYNIETPDGLRSLQLTYAQQGDEPSQLAGINISSGK